MQQFPVDARQSRLSGPKYGLLRAARSGPGLSILFAAPSLSASTRNCGNAQTAFACQLDVVLHFLYAFASVLAILFVAVVLTTILIYRKKRDTRSPYDV